MPSSKPKNPLKLLVIVGPTSSGKSELAVQLARRFNGEIISADSRQVYRGMDIGSGKVAGSWSKRQGRKYFVYKNIAHHLIDFRSPKNPLSAGQYQKLGERAINGIARRGKLPILCGGTGHWIDAVVFGQQFPAVKPNPRLRKLLEKQTTAELFARLQKLDPARAAAIDAKNPRRLIRALEIIMATGRPVPVLKRQSAFNALWLGLNPGQTRLYKKISRRLNQRLQAGMFHETKILHKQGVSWQSLENYGLDYKFGALFWQKKLTRREAEQQLLQAEKQYAKRQLTWWKRNPDIHWLQNSRQALSLARKFLEIP